MLTGRLGEDSGSPSAFVRAASVTCHLGVTGDSSHDRGIFCIVPRSDWKLSHGVGSGFRLFIFAGKSCGGKLELTDPVWLVGGSCGGWTRNWD